MRATNLDKCQTVASYGWVFRRSERQLLAVLIDNITFHSAHCYVQVAKLAKRNDILALKGSQTNFTIIKLKIT